MSSFIFRALSKSHFIPRAIFTQPQHRPLTITRFWNQQAGSSSSNKVPKVETIRKISPFTWTSFAVGGTLGGIFLLILYYLRERKELHADRARRRSLGKAQIGGSFELVNCKGETVKSSDFLGQWVLIYFGFTHCPDICPDELEKIASIVNELEEKHKFKLQPIFISVDPIRDTPEVVGKYCKEFSDKLIGLTGTEEQIAKACKAYRVYFSAGPKDKDEDYIVDHTIIMYLVDPDGLFVDYYGQTNTVDHVLQSVLINNSKLAKIKGESSWIPSLFYKSSGSTAA